MTKFFVQAAAAAILSLLSLLKPCEAFSVSRVPLSRSSTVVRYSTSEEQQHQQHEPRSDIAKFEGDLELVLKELRWQQRDPSIKGVFGRNKLSFTSIYTPEMWDQHTSRWRYLRHLRGWPTSGLLLRILPQWSVLIVWARISHWISHKTNMPSVPLTPLSLVSTFVGFLLTLRSNQGLSRLTEGREGFGKVVLYTREFADLVAAYVYPKDPKLGMLMTRHTSIFGWSLKSMLRRSDESDVLYTMLGPTDAEYVLGHRKAPVGVAARLLQCTADLWDRNIIRKSEHDALLANIGHMHGVITTCERIQATPIPSFYTAHTSRLLMLYLFFLPLAIPDSTILVTAMVAFAMLGLDEISHMLEEPFRLMPLYQLSKISMKDVADALLYHPPPLPAATDDQAKEQKDSYNSHKKKPTYW